MYTVLKKRELFCHLPFLTMKVLTDHSRAYFMKKKQILLQEGEPVPLFYWIESGSVGFFQKNQLMFQMDAD